MSIITIPNIDAYEKVYANGELLLIPYTDLTREKILDYDFKIARIDFCNVFRSHDDERITRTHFPNVNPNSIITDIWLSMEVSKILENTTFDVKVSNGKIEEGYDWYIPKLNLSYREKKDMKDYVLEIYNMTEINHYKIHLRIDLGYNEVINYKNFDNY